MNRKRWSALMDLLCCDVSSEHHTPALVGWLARDMGAQAKAIQRFMEAHDCANYGSVGLTRKELDLAYLVRGLALTNTPVLDCTSWSP